MNLLATTIATLLLSQGPEAGVFDEFTGIRSASMGGAHRGVGTSNDTIYMNPAGMAIARRYSLDATYAFSPFDDLNRINLSIVDSKSGPIAGGVGYTLVNGDDDGIDANISRYYGAIAYPLIQNLTLGFNVRYVRGSLSDTVDEAGERVSRNVRIWNGDVGVAGSFGNVGFGLVYQNALDTDDDEEAFTPRAISGGISINFGQLILAGDLVSEDVGDEDEQTYSVGLEYFVQDTYALRAGYRFEPFLRRNLEEDEENIITGGLGYVTGEGAVDIGFFRSLDRSNNWQLLVGVHLFL